MSARAVALLFLAGCAQSGASASLQSFDAARAFADLEAMVAIGPRPAGSEGAEKTRLYIEAELARAGIASRREEFIAETPIGPIAMANVIADLPGASPTGSDGELPLIVIGSHYDTKRFNFPFVGANDGGSSTAVLLELARVLNRASPEDHAYRLIFFDGEEAVRKVWIDPDNCYGSRHHVERLRREGGLHRVAVFVLLDMVGDRDLKLTRDQHSDQRLLAKFFEAARAEGLSAHIGGKSEPINDDHLSFMAADIRSVLLMDFEYGPKNKYWHTAQDTLENCSAESLGAIGRIVLAGLPQLLK